MAGYIKYILAYTQSSEFSALNAISVFNFQMSKRITAVRFVLINLHVFRGGAHNKCNAYRKFSIKRVMFRQKLGCFDKNWDFDKIAPVIKLAGHVIMPYFIRE